MSPTLLNAPAPNVPYFTPAQIPAAGAAVNPQSNGKPIPKLFQPLKIRGVEFQNRIWLAPLCQYSADKGRPTAWHMAHLGGIISRGTGLALMEATAVVPEGRITPEDLGLWSDEQIPAFAEIVTFAHSQNQKIGIQLAHSGRKGSMVAPWLSFSVAATAEQGGWPDNVRGPSAVEHAPGYCMPKALSTEEVHAVRDAFAAAAARAVKAGFDVIEIHSAHGYLLHEFMSPVANQRTDAYGGSFENRTRLHVEIADAVRAVIPKDMPLFFRISGTDRLETSRPDLASWKIEDSIKLSSILADHGVDLMDISTAGVHREQDLTLKNSPAFQSDVSGPIKAAVGDKILVATVGGVSTGKIAQDVLDDNLADVCFVGRWLQKNPGLVWQFAEELGVEILQAHQIEWGFSGRGLGRRTQASL